jgi:predicted phosphate transport protein (TIGR00153 family)
VRFQILPAETKFFDWFEKGSGNLLRAANLLLDMVVNYERAEEKLVIINEAEREGDAIEYAVLDLLRKTLITPLDQEEIHALIMTIDDAVDLINRVAIQMVVYQVERPTEEARRFATIIVKCAEEVDKAMPMLRDSKHMAGIQRHSYEINRLEGEADLLLRQAMEKLIAASRNDWFEFMRWKEIYDKLEQVTNRCEGIADVLQTVVLKHA